VADYELALPIKHSPLIVSGGVGENIEFELFMIDNYDARVFCFDFTNKSKRYIAPHLNENLSLVEKGLSNNKSFTYFQIPDHVPVCSTSEFNCHENNRPGYASSTISCVSIDDIINEYNYIDILKIDIEGSEYGLLSELTSSDHIGQICGEFHSYRLSDIGQEEDAELIQYLISLGYTFKCTDTDHQIYLFYKGDNV